MDDSSLGYVGTQDDVLVPRAAAFVIDHLVSITLGAFLGLQLGMALDWVLWVYVGVIGGTLGYFVVLEWLFGKTMGNGSSASWLLATTAVGLAFDRPSSATFSG